MTSEPMPGPEAGYAAYPHDYVAYEYLTVQAGRDLESLYADTYRSFGWIVESASTGVLNAGAGILNGNRPGVNTVTLRLKRDRRIRNRSLINELQRKAENALAEIQTLERSRTTTAVATALGIGIVGSAFLAGSIFAIEANLWLLSIPLGAIGLLGWLAGYLAHGRVKAKKTAQTAPLIDEQYELVYEASEQAARLLA